MKVLWAAMEKQSLVSNNKNDPNEMRWKLIMWEEREDAMQVQAMKYVLASRQRRMMVVKMQQRILLCRTAEHNDLSFCKLLRSEDASSSSLS